MPKNVTLQLLLIILMFLNSCGDRSPKVEKASEDAKVVVCDKKSCEPVQVFINASGVVNGKLTAYVGQPVSWEFVATAENAPSRDIRMIALNLPIGAKVIGENSSKITINYTPTDIPANMTKPISIVTRDVSRCKFLKPSNPKICEDLKTKKIDSVETTVQYDWEVLENPNLVDPTFTQPSNQQQIGANSGMTGCITGFIPGFIDGLLGGNILGGIINGAKNCIGKSIQQLPQQNP